MHQAGLLARRLPGPCLGPWSLAGCGTSGDNPQTGLRVALVLGRRVRSWSSCQQEGRRPDAAGGGRGSCLWWGEGSGRGLTARRCFRPADRPGQSRVGGHSGSGCRGPGVQTDQGWGLKDSSKDMTPGSSPSVSGCRAGPSRCPAPIGGHRLLSAEPLPEQRPLLQPGGRLLLCMS